MAFGIKRQELKQWKKKVEAGEIAFLTHYWHDDRFPHCTTVTKAGCNDLDELIKWGKAYGLQAKWLDNRGNYPHFDLFGDVQYKILAAEQQWGQIKKFNLRKTNE